MNEAPLTRNQLVVMTIGLGLGTFLVSLDFAISNVSIPNISGVMAASPSQGTWAITSFAAANAVALPLTGWLAKRFGEVHLFVGSAILFTLASLFCGMSTNLPTLIGWRIVQGLVSGPMLPLSQAILLHHFPARMKGMAMAVVSMTVTIAPLTGPIVGGLITDNWSWPWIFYINIPLGIVCAAMVWFSLRGHETDRTALPIDRVGLALLVVGVVFLQVLVDKGRELDWLNSAVIVAMLVVVVIVVTYLVIWELGDEHPVIDIRLFADRNFFIGTMATSLTWAGLFASLVMFPLWLQTRMGYTATWAGITTASFGVFIMIFTPFVGRFLAQMNLKYLLTVSFFLLWLGLTASGSITTQASAWDMAWPRMIMGAGLGLFFVPLLTIALSNIPQHRMASATGMFYFTRTLAGSIGASLGITLWERREIFHHARLAETITAADVINNGANGAGIIAQQGQVGYGLAEFAIWQQSSLLGMNDVLYLTSLLVPPLLIMIWFARPPFVAGGGK
ncbi:MAG: MFS transporter [Gammaproteobacteria bacterium]|nr:MAG: MFS transporter [Gammaproteobacteria bacterium]